MRGLRKRNRQRSGGPFSSLERPPGWAAAVIAVLVAAIAVMIPMTLHRATPSAAASPAEITSAAASPTATGPVQDGKLYVTRPTGRPMNVLFAGDSLTYGLYATAQSKGYAQLVVDALSQGGPVNQFRGEKPGAGAGVVASITAVPPNIDLAIVELGTNDVGGQTPLDTFRSQYAGLLDKIFAGSPNARLMCVGTWGSAGGGFGSDPYNNVIRQECIKRQGLFVSMYNLFPQEKLRGPAGQPRFGGTSDDFHPNDAGYKAIADLLLSDLVVR